MQFLQNYLWLIAGLLLVLLISLASGRLRHVCAVLGLNALSGLALLAAINMLSAQLFLPLNGVTVAVSSLLGLPGVAALAVLALV